MSSTATDNPNPAQTAPVVHNTTAYQLATPEPLGTLLIAPELDIYPSTSPTTAEQLNTAQPQAWQLWAAKLANWWYLYALKTGLAVHLGAFQHRAELLQQQQAFSANPKTTVLMHLPDEELQAWLDKPNRVAPPRFCGQLGSHWGGYGIKPLNAQEVELIHAADLRHEWLGVFSEPEAFALIQQHYDQRRNSCPLC